MKRVNMIIASSAFREFLQELATIELNRKYCTHGWDHLVSVSRIAYITALEEDGLAIIRAELPSQEVTDQVEPQIKELIYAAGLLHDFGRPTQYYTKEDHAHAGARLALPVLEGAMFTPGEIELITQAIKGHRHLDHHTSYLAKIIAGADKLARQCNCCRVKSKCNKFDQMPTNRGLIY